MYLKHLEQVDNLNFIYYTSDTALGMMVMPRTPLPASWAEEIDAAAEIDEVDSSLLPPG